MFGAASRRRAGDRPRRQPALQHTHCVAESAATPRRSVLSRDCNARALEFDDTLHVLGLALPSLVLPPRADRSSPSPDSSHAAFARTSDDPLHHPDDLPAPLGVLGPACVGRRRTTPRPAPDDALPARLSADDLTMRSWPTPRWPGFADGVEAGRSAPVRLVF